MTTWNVCNWCGVPTGDTVTALTVEDAIAQHAERIGERTYDADINVDTLGATVCRPIIGGIMFQLEVAR